MKNTAVGRDVCPADILLPRNGHAAVCPETEPPRPIQSL